jgi:hypothetical protein
MRYANAQSRGDEYERQLTDIKEREYNLITKCTKLEVFKLHVFN